MRHARRARRRHGEAPRSRAAWRRRGDAQECASRSFHSANVRRPARPTSHRSSCAARRPRWRSGNARAASLGKPPTTGTCAAEARCSKSRWPREPTRLANTPATSSAGSNAREPAPMAAIVRAMRARVDHQRCTGAPSHFAISRRRALLARRATRRRTGPSCPRRARCRRRACRARRSPAPPRAPSSSRRGCGTAARLARA